MGRDIYDDVARWVNRKKVLYPDLEKPCVKLAYYPYGALVEVFPLSSPRNKLSCEERNGAIVPFGHDCPVHYLSEFVEA